MATVTLKNLADQNFGGTPYGNQVAFVFPLVTNSSGVITSSDQATALTTSDTARIGIVPAGTQLLDALGIVSDAFTTSSTFKIGFAYVDGVDSTAVPQDDDYFFAALANDATGRTRANNNAVRPVVLPKDAYITVGVGTASLAAAGVMDLVVYGAVVGQNGNGVS
jgi:hypothetical protein